MQRAGGALKMELQALIGKVIFELGFKECARVCQTQKGVG